MAFSDKIIKNINSFSIMTVVLVTGGFGFIGSNIVEKLLKDGFSVKILDNASTGNEENIKDLSKKVEIARIDIRNQDKVMETVKGCDYILHQAALPSVSRSVENPVETNSVNVEGSLNILEAARRYDVERIVYASSSSVYGDTEVLPKKEDMIPKPLSPYAVSKLAMEYYFSVFHKVYGIRSIGLRYFNVYGPRQNPDSEYAAVIPRFIKAVIKGERPVIYGDGEQTRDFTYVKDVVKANILAMNASGIGHDIFNIARGERISINTLLEKICTIIGKKLEAVHTEPRKGDIRHSLADISKAREILGYEPQYDIEEGLKETIEWFRKRL